MPLFDYAGQLESGRVFRGTLEADSHDRARATLTDMGVRVTDLRPTGQLAFVAPLSLTDFQYLNEQIAMMTEAGVPLEQGLRQLAADVARGRLKRVLLDLANTLAAALRWKKRSNGWARGFRRTMRARCRPERGPATSARRCTRWPQSCGFAGTAAGRCWNWRRIRWSC